MGRATAARLLLGLALARRAADAARDVRVPMCNCAPAKANNGLSCGYGQVLTRFEHTADQSDFVVPLSNAQCCSPCLPENRTSLRPDDPVQAVVNLGCAPANENSVNGAFCDGKDEFLAGFQNARPVVNGSTLPYYPEGRAMCCKLGFVFKSGSEPMRLRRCDDCAYDSLSQQSGNPGCLNMPNGGGAYVGFRGTRRSLDGYYVPVAPAECCGMCTSTELPADPCAELGDCGDHGVCDNGICQCVDGWDGTTCSIPPPTNSDDGHADAEAYVEALKHITLFIVSAVAGCLAFVCICMPRQVAMERRRRVDEEEPLIGSDASDSMESDESSGTESSVTLSPSESEEEEEADDEGDVEEGLAEKADGTGTLSAHRPRCAGAGPASRPPSVPKEFKCPITMRCMRDPVVCADGYTYERKAIARWLRVKRCSPCTNAPVSSRRLVANHSLRGMILAFHESHGRCSKAAAAIRRNLQADNGKGKDPAQEASAPSGSGSAPSLAASDPEADERPSPGGVELARNPGSDTGDADA